MAVMLSACGGEAKNGGDKRVGDIIMLNGELGVVFAVTADGQHGKVMSVSETCCTWDNAKKWCANLGRDWRLPTKDELQVISRKKSAINSVLSTNGYTILPIVYAYWSLELFDEFRAWFVSMRDGSTYRYDKDDYAYVRAVAAF